MSSSNYVNHQPFKVLLVYEIHTTGKKIFCNPLYTPIILKPGVEALVSNFPPVFLITGVYSKTSTPFIY
jgi:hypothetical protein